MMLLVRRTRGAEKLGARLRTRRYAFLAALLGLAVLALGLASGCGKQQQPASSQSAAAAITRGGVMKYASQETVNIDPAVAATGPDYQFIALVYDKLIDVDQKMKMHPRLAVSWTTTDGKTWTFKLREGVVFHDGKPFTADDVIYTYNRLKDPDVGSNQVDVFANIDSMQAVDDHTLVIKLKKVTPEFPLNLTAPQTQILEKGVKNPSDKAIGTGPFMVDSWDPQVQAVMKANPNYWEKGADGKPLPYLGEIDVIYSPELAGQVEACRSGQLDFVGGLSYELGATVTGAAGTKILTVPSNLHYDIHMNCKQGASKDPRVRLALRLGTDTVTMAKVLRPGGLAEAGNGTLVGPTYPYYLNQKPPYDPVKAKQLLAEAGYANGVDVTLQVQNAYGVPAIGTMWQEQMKKIGVNVHLQVVPQDVYYGDGPNNWLDCEYGITDWGPRPSALMYWQLSYMTNAPWSGSKWSDAEFDSVCNQIATTVDEAKRNDLYRKAQEILIDRQPDIIPYFETSVCVVNENLNGVYLAPDWSQTTFTTAWMAQ